MSTCTVSQITSDGAGNTYVYDITSAYILKLSSSNGAITRFSSFSNLGGGGSCSNTSIIGLVANADGSLFAGSPKAGRIYQISKTGGQSNFATLAQPYRLDHNGSGGVYAVSAGVIYNVSSTGAVSTFYNPSTPLKGGTNSIRRDSNGDVYFIVGTTIYKIHPTTKTVTPIVACIPAMTDITFGKASQSTTAPLSLFISTIGTGISANDGDRIFELQR